MVIRWHCSDNGVVGQLVSGFSWQLVLYKNFTDEIQASELCSIVTRHSYGVVEC